MQFIYRFLINAHYMHTFRKQKSVFSAFISNHQSSLTSRITWLSLLSIVSFWTNIFLGYKICFKNAQFTKNALTRTILYINQLYSTNSKIIIQLLYIKCDKIHIHSLTFFSWHFQQCATTCFILAVGVKLKSLKRIILFFNWLLSETDYYKTGYHLPAFVLSTLFSVSTCTVYLLALLGNFKITNHNNIFFTLFISQVNYLPADQIFLCICIIIKGTL